MTHTLPVVVLWFVAGAVLGSLHLLTLRWSIGLFTAGKSAWLALGVQAARFAVVGGALTLVAMHRGPLPLLAMAGGLIVARLIVVRVVARA